MVAAEQKREKVTYLFADRIRDKDDAFSRAIYDEASERALLGCVLHKPELYALVSSIVQAGDFWNKYHGLIWYVVDKLINADKGVDPITVATELIALKANDYKDSFAFNVEQISSLMGAAPNLDNIQQYALRVLQISSQTRMLQFCEDMKDSIVINKNALSHAQLLDEFVRGSYAAVQQKTGTPTSIRAITRKYIDSFEGNPASKIVPTGIHFLDKLLGGGVFSKEVTILAGATGMGKTTMMLSIIRNACERLKRVVYFSMEMEQEQIIRAFVSMLTGIPRGILQGKNLTDGQYQRMIEVLPIIANWKLDVIDMHEFPNLTPAQLRRKLRTLLLEGEIDLVVLDGLWLMEPDVPPGEQKPERHRAVGEITIELSGICKAFDVPILLVHQYHDRVAKTAKKPQISFLAESVGAKRNSEVILGLWRPSYFDPERDDTTRVYKMKDRNRGNLNFIEVAYDPKVNRYE